MSPHGRKSPVRLQSATALALAAMVFVLGLLALSPDLHARLHGLADPASACADGRDHTDASPSTTLADDSGCVVTLFAQGLPAPDLAPQALPPRLMVGPALPPIPLAQASRDSARLHPPAQAPPADRV